MNETQILTVLVALAVLLVLLEMYAIGRDRKVAQRHADGGRRCLVMHDRDGMRQCVWCSRCRRWIRPERMDDRCEGRSRRGGIGG